MSPLSPVTDKLEPCPLGELLADRIEAMQPPADPHTDAWTLGFCRARKMASDIARAKGWNEQELAAIHQLGAELELPPMQVLRCALRRYHSDHERLKAGETVTWSGDAQRAADFAGPLSRHNARDLSGGEGLRDALQLAANRLRAAAINATCSGDKHSYEYSEWADEAQAAAMSRDDAGVVTEDMVEAGVRVLDARRGGPGTFREDVKAIYAAMHSARTPVREDVVKRLALDDLREELRVTMLEQPISGLRETYNDGFAEGVCYAIGKLDAINDPGRVSSVGGEGRS